MIKLTEIEQSVSQLPEDDFAKFRQWFWQYDNEKWGIKIENDIAEKKSGALASKALSDYNNGKYKTL